MVSEQLKPYMQAVSIAKGELAQQAAFYLLKSLGFGEDEISNLQESSFETLVTAIEDILP